MSLIEIVLASSDEKLSTRTTASATERLAGAIRENRSASKTASLTLTAPAPDFGGGDRVFERERVGDRPQINREPRELIDDYKRVCLRKPPRLNEEIGEGYDIGLRESLCINGLIRESQPVGLRPGEDDNARERVRENNRVGDRDDLAAYRRENISEDDRVGDPLALVDVEAETLSVQPLPVDAAAVAEIDIRDRESIRNRLALAERPRVRERERVGEIWTPAPVLTGLAESVSETESATDLA